MVIQKPEQQQRKKKKEKKRRLKIYERAQKWLRISTSIDSICQLMGKFGRHPGQNSDKVGSFTRSWGRSRFRHGWNEGGGRRKKLISSWIGEGEGRRPVVLLSSWILTFSSRFLSHHVSMPSLTVYHRCPAFIWREIKKPFSIILA